MTLAPPEKCPGCGAPNTIDHMDRCTALPLEKCPTCGGASVKNRGYPYPRRPNLKCQDDFHAGEVGTADSNAETVRSDPGLTSSESSSGPDLAPAPPSSQPSSPEAEHKGSGPNLEAPPSSPAQPANMKVPKPADREWKRRATRAEAVLRGYVEAHKPCPNCGRPPDQSDYMLQCRHPHHQDARPLREARKEADAALSQVSDREDGRD